MEEKPQSGSTPTSELALAIGEGAVGELYERGLHLYSTRSAEAFEATHRESGERVLLWVLRYPLALDSEAPRQFVKRISDIVALRGPVPKVRAFGVDSRGVAYVVLGYLNGRSPIEASGNSKSAERTFVELLQAVSAFHRAGIVLGDISFDSFARDESGRLIVWAVTGSFDGGAKQTAMLPPPETLPFLAPEQKTVGSLDSAIDIYALGVYGYRLFTGRPIPAESLAAPGSEITAFIPPPSSVKSDLPTWVDDVLGRALESDPAARFVDAAEMIKVIQEAMRSGSPPGGGSRWSRRTLMVTKDSTRVAKPGSGQAQQPKRPTSYSPATASEAARVRAVKRVNKAVNTLTWSAAILVGVLCAGLVFYVFERLRAGKADDPCEILAHNEYAPSDLKPLIFDVTATEVPLDRREVALRKISENRDPIAYAILVGYSGCRLETRLASVAEELLVERIRAQGTERSANILSKWFSDVGARGLSPIQTPEFLLLTRSLDVSRPLESRQQALRDAYAQAQVPALKFAGALSLDEREERFTPVLRELLLLANPSVDYEGRGVGALILAHPVLLTTFTTEISAAIPKFSDNDLKWAAQRLSNLDNVAIYDVAGELVKRRVLPPFQTVFLRALSDAGKYQLTTLVQQALVRGGLGILTREDVLQLGRWTSIDAEDVLFAAAATGTNQGVVAEGFEVLASRTLNNEPGASLIKWVKSGYWDHREKLAKPIGVLGLTDVASEQEVLFSFEQLKPFSGNGTLFGAIVQSQNEKLIRLALTRLADSTPGEELLPLLLHKSRGVRMQTVASLKGRNELGVLQGILQGYARERDEEVREAYRQNHWVTQDRDPKKIFK